MATGDMHGVAEAGGPSFSGGGTSAPGGPGGAGGLGSGTGAEQGELANAIANAMAAGAFNQDVWDPGAAEAQDVAATEGTINQPGMVTGNMYATTPDFAAEQQPAADVSYGAGYNTGYQDVIGSNTGLAQAQLANAAFYAPPTVFQGEGGGYTPQSTGAPGASWNDYSAPTGGVTSNIQAASDLIEGGRQLAPGHEIDMVTEVDSFRNMPGALPASKASMAPEISQGIISGGTIGPQEASVDQQGGLISAATRTKSSSPQTQPEEVFTADKATQIDAKVKQTPEWHTQRNKDLSQERLNHVEALDNLDRNATYIGSDGKPVRGVTNGQVADAYRGFDSTLEAYAVINGTGSLGQLLGMAIPFANALPMAKGFLVNNGLYDTSTGTQIADTIAQAIASGEPLGGGIGGPSNLAESGAIDQAVRDFVTQYPWAKGLDPRYIQ